MIYRNYILAQFRTDILCVQFTTLHGTLAKLIIFISNLSTADKKFLIVCEGLVEYFASLLTLSESYTL